MENSIGKNCIIINSEIIDSVIGDNSIIIDSEIIESTIGKKSIIEKSYISKMIVSDDNFIIGSELNKSNVGVDNIIRDCSTKRSTIGNQNILAYRNLTGNSFGDNNVLIDGRVIYLLTLKLGNNNIIIRSDMVGKVDIGNDNLLLNVFVSDVKLGNCNRAQHSTLARINLKKNNKFNPRSYVLDDVINLKGKSNNVFYKKSFKNTTVFEINP